MKCPKRTEHGVFCIRPQSEWREIWLILLCICFWLYFTRYHWAFLSLTFQLFLDQKKRTIKLNCILGLLGNSREILSAAVLDSTDAKCINTFIELIFIYNRRLTLFYKELTGWVEQLYRRIPTTANIIATFITESKTNTKQRRSHNFHCFLIK